MPLIFAYLPEHVFQVGAAVMAASFVWLGIREFRRTYPKAGRVRLGRVPRMPIVTVVLGVGLRAAAVFVNAEGPCRGCRGSHWGGTTGVVGLGVWLAIFALMFGLQIRGRSEGRVRPWPEDCWGSSVAP
jgi:hypothetical protein